MKLYTEEQVKQIQQAILCNHKDAMIDPSYCLNVTIPIEVPIGKTAEEKLFDLANQFAYLGYEKTAVILHSIHNGLDYNETYGGDN
jgi:hypothetical protein